MRTGHYEDDRPTVGSITEQERDENVYWCFGTNRKAQRATAVLLIFQFPSYLQLISWIRCVQRSTSQEQREANS